jgi:hypothetical protein
MAQALWFLALVTVTLSLPHQQHLFEKFMIQKRLAPVTATASLPSPRFFTQVQDHFDGTNTNTWQQA